jgi:hypothetical protein
MTHTILGLMLGLAALYFVVGYGAAPERPHLPGPGGRVTGYEMARPLAGSCSW